MTLFMQYIRPQGRPAYWSAWIDPAGNGSGVGSTKKEALGDLLLALESKGCDELEIRYQPTQDFRVGKGGAS